MKKAKFTKLMSLLLSIMMIMAMLPSMVFAGEINQQENASNSTNITNNYLQTTATTSSAICTTGTAISATVITSEVAKATKYLVDKVTNPSIGSGGGEWVILGLARSGYTNPYYYNKYYENAVEKLKGVEGVLSSTKYTEYSRVAIGVSAIGKDATNVVGYNLIQNLSDYDKVIKQGINGAVYALLALDSKKYEIPATTGENQATRENLVKFILDKEIANGGWALSGKNADPDITAMVLQALAPYQAQTSVLEAVNRGLTQLSNIQQADGGYKSWGSSTAESVSQVITALSVLGIDCQKDNRFIKNDTNLLHNLFLNYYLNDGSFSHTKGGKVNQMATEQAYYALVAYNRMINGKTSLYDMSDTTEDLTLTDLQVAKKALTEKIEAAKKLSELKYTEESWKKLQSVLIEAETINNKADATLIEVEKAISDLDTAISQLVIKESEKNVKLRIEGISANLIDEELKTGASVVTVIDLLKQVLDEKNISYTISNAWGSDYVSSINNEAERYFNKDYDGWQYVVNGISPSVGAGQYTLKDGDEVVFYYGGMSIQYPIIKYTVNNNGTVSINLTANGYDESYNPVVNPIKNAKLTWYYGDKNQAYKEYFTDENGNAVIEASYAGNGGHKLQLEKYDETEVNGKFMPLVVRLSEEYVVTITRTPNNPGTDTKVYLSVYDPSGMTYLLRTGYDPQLNETAYSILLKSGLNVESTTSQYGIYVEGIEGLREFDKGPLSGWMYRVNGRFPSHSSAYEMIYSGDFVEWIYTKDLGRDIGGYVEGIENNNGSSSSTTSSTTALPSNVTVQGNVYEAKQTVEANADLNGDVNIQINSDDLIKAIRDVANAAKGKEVKKKIVIDIKTNSASEQINSINVTIIIKALYEAYKQGISEIRITSQIADIVLSDKDIISYIEKTNTNSITLVIKKENNIQFNDIENHWAKEAISYVYEKGLFNGTDENNFSPDASMTRAMFVTVLGRLAGINSYNTITQFSDVNPKQYYASYIKWAVDNNIVSGNGNNTFAPDKEITREEMSVIIANYIKLMGINYNADTEEFSDNSEISSWAREGIKIIKALNLINGKGDDKFNGKATATRAEVAVIFQRLANIN